jgi:hypothetical protein
MHFTNQQVHRRWCFPYAESITEQIGALCPHLHDARSHRQSAAMHGPAPFVRSPDDPSESLKRPSTAEELTRNVQQTSLACEACATPRTHKNPFSTSQLPEAGHSTTVPCVWILKAPEGPRDERGSRWRR